MSRQFHVLDVFTERAFTGNPLAVVLDSEGLDDAAMLAITREFNLSETVFVLPPDDPVHSAKIRIFTPGGELPFAGHPTVGTAVLLAELRAGGHLAEGVVIALEEKIGLIRAEVRRRPGGAARAVFALPRLPEPIPLPLDPLAVAAALGLDPLEIGFGAHGLSVWSAGVPFVMVPLRSLDAIRRAQIADMAAWRAAFGGTGKGAAYLYTRETVEPAHHIHARMFSPLMGIAEDPATGSAAAAFAGVAALCEAPEDGMHQLVIEQGYEMARPSLIVLDLEIAGGRLAGAAIGGAAVRISEGRIHA
ncbi:PhzF family phenazine biosynthesis isomerase [Rhabdaerophilum calidifontis]|uniref:PhzF family phenazine biosynthesis isomerase n=1 Tax=Rhabdaerophilum calidifontis TaxID=2604328 RepID=UPI00123B8404